MRQPLRSTALIATVFAVTIAAPAQAAIKDGSKTVTSGAVTATLSWKAAGVDSVAQEPHLTITRSGQMLVDADLTKDCSACEGPIDPQHSLHVVDLDGDGEPEVLADLYTGGAHCCSVTVLYHLTSTTTPAYGFFVHNWGDPSYKLADVDGDGHFELVSKDDRFAYEFAAYAFSWLPPRIYDYVGGKLVDRTRSFAQAVKSDLIDVGKTLSHDRGDAENDVRGLVAARVADFYLLGDKSAVGPFLASELKRGDLRGMSLWPAGKKFKPALLKFLRKLHYIS